MYIDHLQRSNEHNVVALLQVEKIVFVVFFSGEQARTKILKICEAFGANCYPVPEDLTKQSQITQEVCFKRREKNKLK